MWFSDEEIVGCHGVWKVRYWWGASLKDASAKQTFIEIGRDDPTRGNSSSLLEFPLVGSSRPISMNVCLALASLSEAPHQYLTFHTPWHPTISSSLNHMAQSNYHRAWC